MDMDRIDTINDGMSPYPKAEKAKKEMKKAGAFFFVLLTLEIPLSFFVYYVQSLFPEEKSVLFFLFLLTLSLLQQR